MSVQHGAGGAISLKQDACLYWEIIKASCLLSVYSCFVQFFLWVSPNFESQILTAALIQNDFEKWQGESPSVIVLTKISGAGLVSSQGSVLVGAQLRKACWPAGVLFLSETRRGSPLACNQWRWVCRYGSIETPYAMSLMFDVLRRSLGGPRQ